MTKPDTSSDEPEVPGDFEPNAFLKNWLVLSYPAFEPPKKDPDQEALKLAFDNDPVDAGISPVKGQTVRIGETDRRWRRLHSKSDTVDLSIAGEDNDYAIAYAWTEVIVPDDRQTVLGIGKDDGIKVWLNGTLIHEKFGGSSVVIDDDLIAVTLPAGVNRLLLKVQNFTVNWGFACRFLDSVGLAEPLGLAAVDGKLQRLKEILDLGATIDTPAVYGTTALQLAKIYGNTEAVQLLLERGANAEIAPPPPAEIADAMLRKNVDGEVPGMSVLVAKDGEILFSRGYGYANLSDLIPFAPHTKSRIGSITKQFTASAILALQEEGKLAITDPLSKFLPDYPRGDEVTLCHLLTHTSGIQSFTDKPKFIETVLLPRTSQEMIDSFKDDPYAFSPGDQFAYNNSGYFLLGVIIEKVSEKSYGDYLKQRFFEPLGMADTGVHTASEILTHEAIGYTKEPDGYRKALNWDMSQAGGAGMLYSTVLDLLRWNEAIVNGAALAKSSREEAWTPVRLNNGKPPSGMFGGYGYGWCVLEFRGAYSIRHNGGLHGFLSNLACYPDLGITITVLHNANTLDPGLLERDLFQIFAGEQLAPYKPVLPIEVSDTSLWQRFGGWYSLGGAELLHIEYSEGRLFNVEPSSGLQAELVAVSDSEFCWPDSRKRITFLTADALNEDSAILFQDGFQRIIYRRAEQQTGN